MATVTHVFLLPITHASRPLLYNKHYPPPPVPSTSVTHHIYASCNLLKITLLLSPPPGPPIYQLFCVRTKQLSVERFQKF